MLMYVAVLAAVIFGLLALVSLAVLISDGAFVGEESAGEADVSVMVLTAALAAGSVWMALVVRRRLRRFNSPRRGSRYTRP
jgi:hypothetical protein